MTRSMHSVAGALCALALAAALALCAGAQAAWADTTAVYTVPATSTYENPVTGEIEDSGGSSNSELGASMVESVAWENALVEIDSDGNTWVTLRLKLADQLGDVGVEVDTDGDGEFSSTEATEMQTAVQDEGEDTEIQLIDYRYQAPSASSYARVTMYVDPMGRDVVFFVALDMDNAIEGNVDEIAFVQTVTAGEEIAGSESDEEEDAADEAVEVEESEAEEEADGEEADEAAVAEETEEDEGSGGSGMAIVVVVVVVVAAAVVAVVAFSRSRKAKSAAQASAAASATSGTAAAAAAAAPTRTHPALADDEKKDEGAES